MSTETFIPPQNIDAEKAVLGGILIDNKSILDLPAGLKPESFYFRSHAKMFEVMLALWAREAPIDVVAVAAEGSFVVADLMAIHDQGMPQSIGYHAELIIAAFQQRQAINRVRE